MKISLIGPAYPLRGGIAHHVYWLHKELTRRGHIVQTISFKKLYPKLLFPGRTTFDASNLKLDADALAMLDPLSPVTWFKAFRAVKDFAPDAVIMEWWNPFFSPCLGMLARLINQAGIKCIMECHNVLPHERSLVDLPLLSFAFSPVESFITHSRNDEFDLSEIVTGRNTGVAALPEVSEFATAQTGNRNGRSILFFGMIRKYKGLDILIEATAKALNKIDCKLIIAGEFYEPAERYIGLVKRLGIENHVRIEDRYIPNEDVPALISEADVLILPYLSATQSGVARIALANNLPIIAARTGGLTEVISEGVNGMLFEPGNADALAETIVRYFTNESGPRFAANIKNSRSELVGSELADLIEAMASNQLQQHL